MHHSGQGHHANSPSAWLWNNTQLADVSFSVEFHESFCTPAARLFPHVFTEAVASVSDPSLPLAPASQDVTNISHRDLGKGAELESCTQGASTSGVGKCCTCGAFEKVYHLHSQVVSSTSAFFRASLTTEVGHSSQMRAGSSSARLWQLHAQMQFEDADAVEAVLYSLYQPQEYGPEERSEHLLMIMKVADLWQADNTATAASRALCVRNENFPLCSVFSLPDGLATSATYANVFSKASRVLFNTFGNARIVIHQPVLQRSLVTLPFNAMYELLHSSTLMTDSEASVLLLFSSWCRGAAGLACSEQQLQQLNSGIRYSRLSSPYLTELCHKLHTPQLKREQLLELFHFRSVPSRLNPHAICHLEGPEGWYLPHRPQCSVIVTKAKVHLPVSHGNMECILAAAADATAADVVINSAPVYFAGFLWTLTLSLKRGELWCGVSAEGATLPRAARPGTPLTHGVMCKVRIWIQFPEPLELLPLDLVYISGMLYGKHLNGSQREEDAHAFVCLDWWVPLMVDGCVFFNAEIMDIQ